MSAAPILNPLSPRQQVLLPALLALAIFMQMLDVTVLNTALPAIAADLNESALNMQSVIVSYVLTVAVCIPISGYISDRFGTQRIFMVAIALFGLGSLFCALADNLTMLIGARVIQGIGGALLTPVARLALMKSFADAELLRVLNYAVMPALLGPILGPLVGGYLVEQASWHWIFLINLPFALFALLCGWKVMPNYTDPTTRLDVVGVFLFGASAFLLTLAFETAGNAGVAYWPLLLVLLGVVLLMVYKRYAQHNAFAIYPLDLFSVRTYRVGLNSNLITRIGIASIPLLLPLLFQVVFGYSPVEAAWLLVPMAIAAMASKPMLQPLLKRFGYKKLLLVNTALIGLLIISLASISQSTAKWWIVVHLLALGVVNSLQFTAVNTLTLAKLRARQKSSANSLMAVNQQLAMGLGTAIGAMLLRFNQQLFGLDSSSAYRAFQLTFVAVGVITLASAFVFMQLHRDDGAKMAQRR